MLKDLTPSLHALGLERDEIDIYYLLTKFGPIPAGDLAKRTDIPRPSLYSILSRLVTKGFAVQSIGRKSVKIFSAATPERIDHHFQSQIEQLRLQQQRFAELAPRLVTEQPASRPRIHVAEGREEIERLIEDIVNYHDIETQSFWPIQDLFGVFPPDFFEGLHGQRIKNNISLRSIWPADQVTELSQHSFLVGTPETMRENRVAPPSVDYSLGYWLYANKVLFVSSLKESFGFAIESSELTETMRAQFNFIWQHSQPIADNNSGLA
jgi:hypothetical protein